MVCLYCQSETKITNSRLQKRNNQVWRRRKCLVCQAIFTTVELADLTLALRVEKNNVLQPFVTDILFTEVLLSLQDRKDVYRDAREITSTIIQNLLKMPQNPVYEPKDISRATAQVLNQFDKQAWHRYAAEHPSLS